MDAFVTDELHRMVYVSQASHPHAERELVALLDYARRWNQENHVTGALAYVEQRFLQVLEGGEDIIHRLFGRICQDRRNHSQRLIFDAAVPDRAFAQWSMGWISEKQLKHVGFDPGILATGTPSQDALDDMFVGFRSIVT